MKSGLRFPSARFGIRAMLIILSLACIVSALFARPIYNYRIEQRTLEQIGDFTQSRGLPVNLIA